MLTALLLIAEEDGALFVHTSFISSALSNLTLSTQNTHAHKLLLPLRTQPFFLESFPHISCPLGMSVDIFIYPKPIKVMSTFRQNSLKNPSPSTPLQHLFDPFSDGSLLVIDSPNKNVQKNIVVEFICFLLELTIKEIIIIINHFRLWKFGLGKCFLIVFFDGRR